MFLACAATHLDMCCACTMKACRSLDPVCDDNKGAWQLICTSLMAWSHGTPGLGHDPLMAPS